VWDGSRILEHDGDSVFPYTIYEAPFEHPDELAPIQEFMIGDPTINPNPMCKHAEPLTGAPQVLGRTTIRYRCQPSNDSLLGATILVDQSTGLLLRSGPLRVSRVDTSPTITPDTFSTQAPPGAKVDTIAAKRPTAPKPTDQKAPPFRLQLLDGGTVSSAEFGGRPYVLAFFSSDLYFDHGELCPRCVPALLLAQQLSHRGTDPMVLAVQNGERGKPGFPLVPPGLTLPIANDPDTALQHAYGLTHEVGFAFVGSDGTIRTVIDHPASSKEISDALSTLD
jgi:peroxiredoxin